MTKKKRKRMIRGRFKNFPVQLLTFIKLQVTTNDQIDFFLIFWPSQLTRLLSFFVIVKLDYFLHIVCVLYLNLTKQWVSENFSNICFIVKKNGTSVSQYIFFQKILHRKTFAYWILRAPFIRITFSKKRTTLHSTRILTILVN